jgi:serine/threonine protein kinase/Tol biopolymer transport system component
LIGQKLAHYEVLELLGQGGMGEVYRARDTKLDRDVALKLLHAEVARDPERLARFGREAKVLASLNHANIASLHGLEEVDGRVFLVMELVEGIDLSERIERGPVGTEEATRIASEIARGLESAHEKGIVHRDLKPSNVKLTPEGQVKILDFGLARIYSGEESSPGDLENSPTITAAFTAAGVILGTAAYMSPEQARGRHVDQRTDIWAFGVVLWEMLRGERLFAGETVSDTLAAVLTRELDYDSPDRTLPSPIRQVLTRCLQRDPRLRLRDIGEARLMLEQPELFAGEETPPTSSPASGSRRLWTLVPWILLLVVSGLAGPRLLSGSGDTGSDRPVRKFQIRAPLPAIYNTRAVEISPDGSMLAIYDREGLWVRPLDEIEPRLLVPATDLDYTETGITPFWSPDSQFIGYGSGGRLWKVAAGGGNPSVVCTLPGGWNGGAWGGNGNIVFATQRGPMYRVPARGGDSTVLLGLTDGAELDYHQPSWVADGEGFLYSVHREEGVDTIEFLQDGVRHVLLRIEGQLSGDVQLLNNPVWSPTGHVIYQRDQGNRGLWALPFDPQNVEVTGESFLIESEAGHPSVSADGTLIQMPMVLGVAGQIVVVSREGTLVETLTDFRSGLSSPTFSASGDRVAYTAAQEQSSDIYVLDRTTGLDTRLTLGAGNERSPTWIPGSNRIAYAGPTDDPCESIWAMDADGLGTPELIAGPGAEPTFGPDGTDLVCTTRCSKDRGLIHFRPGKGDDPAVLRAHPSGIQAPRLSPDGRHIAYITWESGPPMLEVADFPEMTSRRIVERTESAARWSADGRTLYFVAANPGRLIAAELEPGDSFGIRSRDVVFELDDLRLRTYGGFSVTPDEQEFVFVRTEDTSAQARYFTVTENWFEAFREN